MMWELYGRTQERGAPWSLTVNAVLLMVSLTSAVGCLVAIRTLVGSSTLWVGALTLTVLFAFAVIAAYVLVDCWRIYNPRRGSRWGLMWIFMLVASAGYFATVIAIAMQIVSHLRIEHADN